MAKGSVISIFIADKAKALPVEGRLFLLLGS